MPFSKSGIIIFDFIKDAKILFICGVQSMYVRASIEEVIDLWEKFKKISQYMDYQGASRIIIKSRAPSTRKKVVIWENGSLKANIIVTLACKEDISKILKLITRRNNVDTSLRVCYICRRSRPWQIRATVATGLHCERGN